MVSLTCSANLDKCLHLNKTVHHPTTGISMTLSGETINNELSLLCYFIDAGRIDKTWRLIGNSDVSDVNWTVFMLCIQILLNLQKRRRREAHARNYVCLTRKSCWALSCNLLCTLHMPDLVAAYFSRAMCPNHGASGVCRASCINICELLHAAAFTSSQQDLQQFEFWRLYSIASQLTSSTSSRCTISSGWWILRR